jgi:hypothetical protein
MKSAPITLFLAGLAALLAATAAQAQNNAPLTNNMGASTAQAASAPPLQSVGLPPVQPVAQVTVQPTATQGGMTDRPTVRQVSTPLPVVEAATQASAPQPQPSTEQDDATRNDHGALVRALMAAQADGRRAGPLLPMLGPVATASWDRYLESFKHPIPEWFRERVEAQTSN